MMWVRVCPYVCLSVCLYSVCVCGVRVMMWVRVCPYVCLSVCLYSVCVCGGESYDVGEGLSIRMSVCLSVQCMCVWG